MAATAHSLLEGQQSARLLSAWWGAGSSTRFAGVLLSQARPWAGNGCRPAAVADQESSAM